MRPGQCTESLSSYDMVCALAIYMRCLFVCAVIRVTQHLTSLYISKVSLAAASLTSPLVCSRQGHRNCTDTKINYWLYNDQ